MHVRQAAAPVIAIKDMATPAHNAPTILILTTLAQAAALHLHLHLDLHLHLRLDLHLHLRLDPHLDLRLDPHLPRLAIPEYHAAEHVHFQAELAEQDLNPAHTQHIAEAEAARLHLLLHNHVQ